MCIYKTNSLPNRHCESYSTKQSSKIISESPRRLTAPRDDGAVIIIILIIILLIMSITALGLEMSMNEFKSTTRLQSRTLDFYATENCLHQAMQIIYSATEPLKHSINCRNDNCVNDYNSLELTTLAASWWQTHSISCSKTIWRYTQLLTTTDHYTFYRITVCRFPNQFIQVTLGKAFGTKQPIIFSWRQIFI